VRAKTPKGAARGLTPPPPTAFQTFRIAVLESANADARSTCTIRSRAAAALDAGSHATLCMQYTDNCLIRCCGAVLLALVAGDTKGIVGPRTTWREVQWTKVRLLIRNFGLQPWYCGWWPDYCDTLEW